MNKFLCDTEISMSSFQCWSNPTWWIFSTPLQKKEGLRKVHLYPREKMRASYSYLFNSYIHFLKAKLFASYIISNTAADSGFLKLLVGRDSKNECSLLGFVFTWGHLASVGRFFSWKRLRSCFFWSKAIILLTASLSLSSCSNVWKYKRENFYFHSNLCGLISQWKKLTTCGCQQLRYTSCPLKTLISQLSVPFYLHLGNGAIKW